MIGKILGGRYEIKEKIGTGGMADVYKAFCNKLNRYVAVKVLKNEFRDDEEFINRFNLESQAAAGICHSNIVSVYDVGCEDDVHYIVMELVEGITLKSYINTHGMLPWRQALDFSIQICDAMEHAHREGIVHRDIKPQNIMVTADNVLKVMDFGIARTANKDVTTDSNTAIGTVHYISPEQARGGYVDERSDIYSMGVVMYEMLTGRVPFDGETAVSIAIMHMQNKPVPPRDIVLSIPFELEAICLKAMAKEQTERYKNAGDLLSDLKIIGNDATYPVSNDSYKTVEDYETSVIVNKRTSDESDKKVMYKQSNKNKKVKTPEELKSDKKAKIILGCASAAILLVFILVFTVAIKPDIFRDTWFGNLIGVQSTALVIDKIPDFEGRKVDDVVEEYDGNPNIRIIVDSERVESVEYDEGYIVSQSPEAGEKVNTKKVNITVVVSKGLEDGLSEVPKFEGKHYQDAVKMLDKYDISYKIVPDSDKDTPEGYVISQTPSAGKKLTAKTVVTLYVNMEEEEEELTTVPEIEGYDSYDAKTEVENAGLIWGTVTEEASKKPKGVVISQSPAGGSEVKKGYRVSVVISSGEAPEDEPKEDTPDVNNPQMSTRYISITLPQDRAAVNVTVKIDGNTIHEQAYDTASGTADIRLTSHGTKSVEIYFDGELSESTTINFDE